MTESAATPDWVSPPGDTIQDIIEEKGWTQASLAERLGYSEKHVNQLIKGKVPLTEDAAIRLERVLGSTVRFWLAREAEYRESSARLEATKKVAEWAKNPPDKQLFVAMMAAKIIPMRKVDAITLPGLIEEWLRFFGVASPTAYAERYHNLQAQFRRTREEKSDPSAVLVWLRQGEITAESLGIAARYDKARLLNLLPEIRLLTVQQPEGFLPRLQELFALAGVALVIVPFIPKTHVSGVTRWLTHRPLIQLSLYGKTTDKFWFTLFHEVAHVLLHANDKKSIYLDDDRRIQPSPSAEDKEANDWASDFLIPPDYAPELSTLRTQEQVIEFAHRLGIHPGVVVGRLQHDKVIPYHQMSSLRENISSQ